MIVVIDMGMGNLGSVYNVLREVNAEVKISSDISDIERAEKLILPGVGSFDNGVRSLESLDLIPTLTQKVIEEEVPSLGICLGHQLFSKRSAEGKLPGLGWIDAETVRFDFGGMEKLRVPHMGWNTVTCRKDSPLFDDMYDDMRFYFVHSYHLVCNDESDILTTTFYGYNFVSSIQHRNIFGTQFHPEKSHKFGMKILQNFAELS